MIAKRGGDETLRADLRKAAEILAQRFETGIDPLLPNRQLRDRRTFQSVIERAKHRRREMGAFMRGLDVGRTETSHMDSHGEASLQALMEWAARLEAPSVELVWFEGTGHMLPIEAPEEFQARLVEKVLPLLEAR